MPKRSFKRAFKKTSFKKRSTSKKRSSFKRRYVAKKRSRVTHRRYKRKTYRHMTSALKGPIGHSKRYHYLVSRNKQEENVIMVNKLEADTTVNFGSLLDGFYPSVQQADNFGSTTGLFGQFFNDGTICNSNLSVTQYQGLLPLCSRFNNSFIDYIDVMWRVQRQQGTADDPAALAQVSMTIGMCPLTPTQYAAFTGTAPYLFPPNAVTAQQSLLVMKSQPGCQTRIVQIAESGHGIQHLKTRFNVRKYSIPGYPLASGAFWSTLGVTGGVTAPTIPTHPWLYFFVYFDGGNQPLQSTTFRSNITMKFFMKAFNPRMNILLTEPVALPDEGKEEKKEPSEPDYESLSLSPLKLVRTESSVNVMHPKSPSMCTTPGHPKIGHARIATCRL